MIRDCNNGDDCKNEIKFGARLNEEMFLYEEAEVDAEKIVLEKVNNKTKVTKIKNNTNHNESISPVLEKVQKISETSFLAIFGYKNNNNSTVVIPIGENNKFTPGIDKGQTEEFIQGRNIAAFKVPMNCNETLVWTITSPNGSKKTSTAATPKCPEDDSQTDDEEPIITPEDPKNEPVETKHVYKITNNKIFSFNFKENSLDLLYNNIKLTEPFEKENCQIIDNKKPAK